MGNICCKEEDPESFPDEPNTLRRTGSQMIADVVRLDTEEEQTYTLEPEYATVP